ncbi:MAG: ATP-binding protein, partial [Thermoanaerobaculales bacterium]|nr:ATP-binding protein [Thermoanaerobaculales bacterium]
REMTRMEPANSQRPSAIKIGAWVALSLAIAFAVAIFAGRVPAVALGLGIAVILLGIGILFLWPRPTIPNSNNVSTLRRELDRTRRGYERLFTSVPCFICVLNRDHQIVEANELYREEFGASDRSLCYEVCKGRSSKCPNCMVDQTFIDGEIYSSEETLVTRDGLRVNAVVHTRPIYDDNGEITSVMEVFTDITEIKKLQRQLALMGRAVAGMAHRVKNILMGLEGGIFVVNEGLESGNQEGISEGWEMVERNVELVSRIVKDLLFCAKERTPDFQPDVCPQKVVLEVKELFADRLASDNIELRTELEEPFHTGNFDADGLHNLLCNLVANAVDACRFDPADVKDGHTITLRCRRNGDGSTVFEVEDDGPGISEDLNAKVFEDFFSTKGSEGTGIGLLVAQKVTEDHGGKVTFSSKPGAGTTFSVTIPTAASRPELPVANA